MLKKISLQLILFTLLYLSASAQKIEKPTLTPTEPTAKQKQLINEGAGLHDQGLYAEAIKNYDKVLTENPTCVTAMYEKTLSLYYKKDFDQMLKLAYEGLKYKSSEIPLFYGLIANVYDDQGNPQKAIAIYKQGIQLLGEDTEYQKYLSSLYYNLGLTYFRQKQYKESKETLKKSVPLDFSYASPNYLLAQVFNGTGYKIPALLAAARLISLEVNTQRTQNAVAIFKEILNGSTAKSDNGKITINLNMNAPKDEGDFTSFDIVLGTLTGVKSDINKNKSEIDNFAEAIDTVIGLLADDKGLSTTFVGKTYIPFMIDMKRKGYVKPFACLVLQQGGSPAAQNWLIENKSQIIEFLNWSKSY